MNWISVEDRLPDPMSAGLGNRVKGFLIRVLVDSEINYFSLDFTPSEYTRLVHCKTWELTHWCEITEPDK